MNKTKSLTTTTFTPETVLATLSSYSNNWRLAYDFYNYVSSPPHSFLHTPSTLTLTIDILSKHLEFPLALSLLPKSSPPPLPSLRSLFYRLSAAHLIPDALSLFQSHPSPSSYVLLLDSLCHHRHVTHALSLALPPSSNSPPFPPDTQVFNILLRGWARTRSWRHCREFWTEWDTKYSSIPKDLHSYSVYMDILIKSKKPHAALKLFKHLVKINFPLDTVAYNTAVLAAGEADGPDAGVRAYRTMLDSGAKPNVATFNTLIKLLCAEGRMKEGYSYMSEMRKCGVEPDAITYHCLFRYSTRPQEIMRLFERMVESRCRPRMDTYVMLMKKFGKWGYLRPVMFIWEKIGEHGMSPDAFAYNALIDALLEKGMVEMARRYDEEMLEKGLSAKARRELGIKGLGDELAVNVKNADENDADNNAMCGVF